MILEKSEKHRNDI